MDRDNDLDEIIEELPESSSNTNESVDITYKSEPGTIDDATSQRLQEINNNSNLNNQYQKSNHSHGPMGHQRPNLGVQPKKTNNEEVPSTTNKKTSKTNNNDVGSRNLKNSLANKTKNIWNSRKKKQKKEENEQGESDSSNNDNNESSSQFLDDIVAKGKRKLKIKIVIYASIAGLVVLFFVATVMALFGVDISSTIPALNQGNYGTDKFTSTYEEGTTEYKNEIAYYEKLKKVKETYDKDHGDELKTNYIHALLLYKYYITETHDKNSKGEEIAIDYKKLTDNVDTIVSLVKSENDSDNIDYEKKGVFYNNLKNSQDFKNYYKEALEARNIDELLDEIFDFAAELDNIEIEDNTVMTEETKVTVTKSKEEKKTTKTLSITDYITESIYANATDVNNSETIKAYTIAYSTNIAAQNKKLTIDSNSASVTGQTCSTKNGCSYNSSGVLVDGPGEQNERNKEYYNGGYYYKKPLTTDEINTLEKSVKNVFGNVLVKSDGTYPNLDISKLTGLGDGDYKDILTDSYGSYTIKNIGENSYILDASYGEKKVLVNVKFYDQSNYTTSFCGLKKETIATSGCGVTSMAMVVSTYENSGEYTPKWANDIAKKNGQCGAGRGTDYSHFKYVAKKMGYKTPVFYTKNKSNGWKLPKASYNNILKNLAKGNLVIVNVSRGHFTSGGHYMVLGGIDPDTKKVYVYDPNNKSNTRYRKTGNGWWSFNDIIAPESKAFIIIEKKG